MKHPKSYEEVKQSYKEFMVGYRINRVFSVADKMTPIEGIVFVTLMDVLECFGHHNLKIKPQEKIGKYTVDFLLVYSPLDNNSTIKKIVIECDGHEWHEKTKKQASHDKERDRYLIKNGYTVVHYTGSDIYNDRYKLYSDIEELLLPEDHKCDFGYGPEAEKLIAEMVK